MPGSISPSFILNFGVACANGFLYTYVARSDQVPKPVYADYALTTARTNPVQLDGYGIAPELFLADGGYYFIVKDALGNEMYSRDNVYPAGIGGSGDTYRVALNSSDTDPGFLLDKLVQGDNITLTVVGSTLVISGATGDHKLLVNADDPVAGYLASKLVLAAGQPGLSLTPIYGRSGSTLALQSLGMVSVDGTDVIGYLGTKIAAGAGIVKALINGTVLIAVDLDYLNSHLAPPLSNYTGPSHQVPFWGAADNGYGPLVTTPAFTFGDPTKLGALCVPSLQSLGSIIIGDREGFWDGQFFTMNYPTNGGQISLTPGYSNTKYISAHNSEGNATVATDKASFANLAQNGVVFASMLPNTSEDLIYLHTDDGLSYNPTTKLFTVPDLAIGSIDAAGVLVNDASGKVSSVPASTFSDDHLVFATAQDTNPGPLGLKLGAGANIGFNVTSDSRGDKLWISARANMLLNPTYVQANYTIVDTDTEVVYNGTASSVTITLPPAGSTHNGRGIYISSTASNATVTMSGTMAGDSAYFTGIGQRQIRCLKMPDNSWAWIVRAN